MPLNLPAGVRLGQPRRPPLPSRALERGGGLVLVVEPDARPGFSGCLNVTRVYWNGRRYQVPRAWRRFL